MSDFVQMAQNLGIRGSLQGPEFRARCPMHSDRSPSFSMNVASGVWICFRGCGKGDFIRLVELILNCSPSEARIWVDSNGVDKSTAQTAENTAKRFGFITDETQNMPANEDWRTYFQSLSSATMPLWFLERGFTWETVNHWGIRYDNVLDAVVLPVFSGGKLIGTVTRNTLPYLPKYENSNFHKNDVLFGEISNQVALIIICEGVLDALWLWQNGYNAASILGSELSQNQVEIIRRYRFGEIVLALDNDDPGEKGTKNAVRLLTKSGWLLPQIKIIHFPKHPYKKDANDCDPTLLKQLFERRERVINGLIFA